MVAVMVTIEFTIGYEFVLDALGGTPCFQAQSGEKSGCFRCFAPEEKERKQREKQRRRSWSGC